MDQILATLDSHGIPSHFKEIVNAAPQIKVFSISLTQKSTFEFEVWVLRSDLERAQAAVSASNVR